MRIFEVSEGRCIDYTKVSSISKHIETDMPRNDPKKHKFWVEFMMDNGQSIEIHYATYKEMDDYYDLFLKAWKSTTDDTDDDGVDIQPIIFRSLD